MLNPFLPWLQWRYSLTEKLGSLAEKTELRLLSQHWRLPNWWDRYILGVQNECVFHREIIMWADCKPCWYARTIIPRATYQENKEFFNRLNNESLGQLVFNNQNVKRLSLNHYPITANCIEYHWLDNFSNNNETILWVRKSTFCIVDQAEFFLIEILLPPLLRYYF